MDNMEMNELRTFAFKTKEEALAAVDKINAKFPNIAHLHDKNPKKVCTEQPESLTSIVCKYVEDELGGKMKGFSLSWF